jgi:hypothetical protein
VFVEVLKRVFIHERRVFDLLCLDLVGLVSVYQNHESRMKATEASLLAFHRHARDSRRRPTATATATASTSTSTFKPLLPWKVPDCAWHPVGLPTNEEVRTADCRPENPHAWREAPIDPVTS